MRTTRLEAFSDGVFAIMVLELKVPQRPQLHLRRHLLEQSSPSIAGCQNGECCGVVGKSSLVVLAFVAPWISATLCVSVALVWLIPDRRIERHLTPEGDGHTSVPNDARPVIESDNNVATVNWSPPIPLPG